MRDRITSLSLKLCAGRSSLTGDEFIDLLHELIEAAAFVTKEEPQYTAKYSHIEVRVPDINLQNETLPPQVHPMKTPQQALHEHDKRIGKHRYSALCWCRDKPQSETNKWCKLLIDNRGKKPEDKTHPVGTTLAKIEAGQRVLRDRPVSEEEKDVIRQLARRAKIGRARLPNGFAKQLALEYDISDSYIYNIIYTDPET